MLQRHLKVRLFFEPSQPLPVLMTEIYPPRVFAVITGPFSSTYSNTESDEGVLDLSCSMYFFSKCIQGSLLLFEKTILDFLYFTLCFRRIFLISAWLILSTIFRSYIRKPASTRNDQVENPNLNDSGFWRCYINYLFFDIISKFVLFMTMLF